MESETSLVIEVDEDKKVTRTDILRLQDEMTKLPNVILGDSSSCPLKHTFADGIYVREIFIPKNTLIVGKIHKHAHPNFLMSGEVSVATEEGIFKLKGPLSMISKPGTKRVVYSHTDVVWITVHEVGEERDLEKIEEIVIAKTYDDYDSFILQMAEHLKLEGVTK